MPKLRDPRIVKIFFSSPFGGMEDEREELTRRYFPHIHHLCNSHGLQFAAVDMRWGITAESSENSQVINICLRELDRSDMFVGFFGQRYGWHGADDNILQQNFDNAIGRYPWLDKFRDKSVTELEFLHGFVNEPGILPATILFRDKAYDDTVREEAVKKGDKKQVFKYSAESEQASSLMDDLKERVWAERDKSLGVHMSYKTPAEAAKIIYDTIMPYLKEKLLADLDVKKLTKNEEVQSQHEAFLASRCNVYVHGDKYMAQLNDILNAEKKNKKNKKKNKKNKKSHILVTGGAGMGKSALLCNWIASLKQRASDCIVFYHFIGFAENSTGVEDILTRMIVELEKHYYKMIGGTSNFTRPESFDSDSGAEMKTLMQRVLWLADKICSLGKTLVLVLDGLDKVNVSGKTMKMLYWLPSKFPSQCLVVTSTVTSDTARIAELKSRKYVVFDIEQLSTEAQHEMSVKTLKESGKELSPSQLKRIVGAQMTKLPLFLKITLTELVSFGYFRLLDKKIDSLINSSSVEELFQKVLQRLEEDYNVADYNGNLVEQVMCSISLSKQGLSEAELKEIYSIPDHMWSPLYFAIERLMINSAGYIQFGFMELKEAVKEKYFSQSDRKQHYLKTLIKHFDEILRKADMPGLSTTNTRPVFELPWLWAELGDKDGLASCLSNCVVFYELERIRVYDLVDLWQRTGFKRTGITERLMKTYDNKVAQLYTDLEHKGLLAESESPGLQIGPLLKSIERFLMQYGYHEAREGVILRHIKVLTEGLRHGVVKSKVEFEEDMYYCKYRLACLKCELYKKQEEGMTLHRELKEHIESQDELTALMKTRLGYACHGLSVGYMYLADYDKVIEYCQQSIDWHNQTEDPEMPSHIAGSYTNIGTAFMFKGQCETALTYFDKTIKIYDDYYLGETPPVIGELFTNKGLCLRRLDRLDEAEKMYQKSLEVKINAVGRNHIIVAMAYINMSALEAYRENFEKAKGFCREALEIHETLGETWTDVKYIRNMENFLGYQASLFEYKDMDTNFMKILDWRIKDGSMDNCIASVYREMAKYYIREARWEDVYKTMYALLDSKHKDHEVSYILMDMAVSNLPPSYRENLPKQFTLAYAVEKFPKDVSLTKQLVENYLVPAGNEDEVARLINRLHSLSPDMAQDVYMLTLDWCKVGEQIEEGCQQRILQEGLLQYPDNLDMMLNLAKSYKRIDRPDLALPLAVKVAEQQLDNPELVFFTAVTAGLAGNMDTGRKYCQHLLDTCKDAATREKATNLLSMIDESESTSQQNNQKEEENQQ